MAYCQLHPLSPPTTNYFCPLIHYNPKVIFKLISLALNVNQAWSYDPKKYWKNLESTLFLQVYQKLYTVVSEENYNVESDSVVRRNHQIIRLHTLTN